MQLLARTSLLCLPLLCTSLALADGTPAAAAEPSGAAAAETPAAAPAPAADAEPASTGVDRSLVDYLKYGGKVLIPFATLTDEPLAPQVQEKRGLMRLMAPCLAPVGGYIWLPRILYGTPPSNNAATLAFRLGIVATVLWWAPGIGCWFYWIPVVGWLLAIIMSSLMTQIQRNMLPRAIDLAYSDAFGGTASDQAEAQKK